MPITQAEADMRAACVMLDQCTAAQADYERMAAYGADEADMTAIREALGRIEIWLRRRAVGGDKILLRQMEQPLGRQVQIPKRGFRGKPRA